MRAARPLLLAVLTGLLFPFAFSVSWLAWFALAPLLAAARGASPGRAALLGLVAGLFAEVIGVGWLIGSGVRPAAFGLLAAFAACRYAAFGLGASLVYRHRPAAAVLALPMLWVALEWLRTNLGWLSIPWGLLGYTQVEVAPMLRSASVAGVYGVSWVLMVGNVALADLLERARGAAARPAPGAMAGLGVAAGLAVAIVIAGNLALATPAGTPGLRVGIVQAGVYDPETHDGAERDAIFRRYLELTQEVAGDGALDLVVWPESSVPVAVPHDVGALGVLFRLAQELDTRLLVAASGRNKRTRSTTVPVVANSAFLIGPAAQIEGRYDKLRLLPFDEYLPLRRWISWPSWVSSLRRDAVPGSERAVLQTEGLRYGIQICFESLFPSEGRLAAGPGVDFLVTLTNESFAGPPPVHEFLFAMNVFRAAENGLPLVRATTTSISAVVSADGQVLERASGDSATLVAQLPGASPPTWYRRHGDLPLLALGGVALVALLPPYRSRRLAQVLPEGGGSSASELLP